jgi:hypothetical protein
MRVNGLYLLIFLLYGSNVQSQLAFKQPEIKDTRLFGQGTSHTAWLLKNGREVRILVYGQSISAQEWWKEVRSFLEMAYPQARIHMVNKAIGGFSSERLKLTVDNDVISFYPDLVLFHDYGNEGDYETIIQTIRKRTTAEIAVQTDHMAVQAQTFHDKHSEEWLPALCRKYELALLDVRTAWKAYLQENNLTIEDLLTDGVHLNRQGNHLMAAIITTYLKNLPQGTLSTHVKTLHAGTDFRTGKRKLRLPVSGNRVDVVWKANPAPAPPLRMRIDKQKPSSFSDCYYHTRPALDTTSFFLKNIGQLLAMDLRHVTGEEAWQLNVEKIDSVQQRVWFSVHSSASGFEGKGTSDSVFVSRSGKVTIQPAYWFFRKNEGDFGQFRWLQPGDVLQWQIKSMCRDAVQPQPAATTTFVQGLQNGPHQLVLKAAALRQVKAIVAYEPPLQ